MLEDALKGAIIGAICGLIIWLFRKYQEKRNGSESARETQTNQGSAQAFALLSVGGFMNDRLFPLYEKPPHCYSCQSLHIKRGLSLLFSFFK